MEMYCLKCKKETEIKDGIEKIILVAGQPKKIYKGKCAVCGSPLMRILKSR